VHTSRPSPVLPVSPQSGSLPGVTRCRPLVSCAACASSPFMLPGAAVKSSPAPGVASMLRPRLLPALPAGAVVCSYQRALPGLPPGLPCHCLPPSWSTTIISGAIYPVKHFYYLFCFSLRRRKPITTRATGFVEKNFKNFLDSLLFLLAFFKSLFNCAPNPA
jgi:hypothetical protein